MATGPSPFRSTGPRGYIKVDINQRDIDRVTKQLSQFKKTEYMARGKRVFYLGVKMFEPALRNATPHWRYPDPPNLVKRRPARGLLRKAIKTRQNELRYGEVGAATTGPLKKIAPHRHLVTAGTQSHSLAPKRPGKGPYEVFIGRSGKQAKSSSKQQYVWRQLDFKAGSGVTIVDFNKGGKLTHPGARKQSYVNMAQKQYEGRVKSFIASEMTKFTVRGPAAQTKVS